MEVKCSVCGVAAKPGEEFIDVRKADAQTLVLCCPACAARRDVAGPKWTRTLIGILVIVVIVTLITRVFPTFNVIVNFLIFFAWRPLVVLVHELGHALGAVLSGLQVFKISLGSGRLLFKRKIFGTIFEWHGWPLGGVTSPVPRSAHGLRVRYFFTTLMGPLSNLIVAGVLWQFVTHAESPSGLYPIEMFILSNVLTGVTNLIPFSVKAIQGAAASDGRTLIALFRWTPFQLAESLTAPYLAEALDLRNNNELNAARRTIEQGLQKFPDSFVMQHMEAILLVDVGEFERGREIYLRMLRREDAPEAHRIIVLNNLAAVDVCFEGDHLLEEADLGSKAAYLALPMSPAIQATRGAVLVRLGEIEGGMTLLKTSLTKDDDMRSRAWTQCFIALGELGQANPAEAKGYLELARELDPKCVLLSQVERRYAEVTGSGRFVLQ